MAVDPRGQDTATVVIAVGTLLGTIIKKHTITFKKNFVKVFSFMHPSIKEMLLFYSFYSN
jgi:hypothetical protein